MKKYGTGDSTNNRLACFKMNGGVSDFKIYENSIEYFKNL